MARMEKSYVPCSQGLSGRAVIGRYAGRGLWAVWILLVLAVLSSTFHYVKPGEIAVIKNNLTGSETLKLTDGVVVHAPLGITRVYVLDKTLVPVRMTAQRGVGDRQGVDNVRIKTSDGTNVYVDVELAYNINPEMAQTIIRTFGRGNAYKLGFVRSLARSRVRDTLGQLSLQEISAAPKRQAKAEEAIIHINDLFSTFGLVITSLGITDLDYSEQYKALITERLKVEQEILNQESARITAESEKLAAKAGADRRKNTMIEQIRGEQRKRVIDAEGHAIKILKEAEAETYKTRKEGDQQYEVALNEARAVEQEGLKKAEGIQRMVEAYRTGGLALIRETLAAKYAGKQIKGKPYTLDSHVERLRIETEGGAAVTVPPPGGRK